MLFSRLKKTAKLFIVALAAMNMVGCGEVLVAITSPIRNMQVQVQNTLPGPLGYVWADATVLGVKNCTGYYAAVYADSSEMPVGIIAPGGVIYDSWLMDWSSARISMVAVLYNDPQCTQWVGMYISPVTVYKHRSTTWSIDRVYRPDNSYASQGYGLPIYPTPQAGWYQKVSIPMPANAGTNNLDVSNCTNLIVVVQVNNIPVARLKPSQSWRWSKVIDYHRASLNIGLSFEDDGGRLYGYCDLGTIALTPDGPYAWQHMVRPNDMVPLRF